MKDKNLCTMKKLTMLKNVVNALATL